VAVKVLNLHYATLAKITRLEQEIILCRIF
jgi:hypothetical protein